jgi:hypothetical protein
MAQLRHWQMKLQSQDPDQRNRDIFSYPIFSFSEGKKRRHISGDVRRFLNENQQPRWDYFFRPNLGLIKDIDEERYVLITEQFRSAKAELGMLEHLPGILSELEAAKLWNAVGISAVAICAGIALLCFAFNSTWWQLFGALAIFGLIALVAIKPWERVGPLEEARQQLSERFGFSVHSVADAGIRKRQLDDQIVDLARQANAIARFREEIASQRPQPMYSAKDMDLSLNQALQHLVEREQRRLNFYDEEEAFTYGPVVRWALETDRKQTLEALRPSVHSVARRRSHYARYYMQIIFIHRGQLTLYQGFYDLILGEFMGEIRTHIILANLFSLHDDTTQDYDFRRRLDDAISLSYSNESASGVESDEDEQELHPTGGMANQIEDDPDIVSVIQTTIVRFVGGETVELRFVVSGHRESLIAQLQRNREIEEDAIANLQATAQEAHNPDPDLAAELGEHEERLNRIQEDEERARRTTTAHNVEHIVNQILEHTRRAVDHRYRGIGP